MRREKNRSYNPAPQKHPRCRKQDGDSKNEIREVGNEARYRSVLKSKGRRCVRKKGVGEEEGRKGGRERGREGKKEFNMAKCYRDMRETEI